MRSKHSYERHCLDIANAPNEQLKANMRAGINRNRPFCALSTFDIYKTIAAGYYVHFTSKCCAI